ncbi:MAG: hypothetical protein QOF62_2594 [Pyrinomonadaceae bacterium]|nr:hypothetical protein [Pyrinomonadaceae bacterium]
MIRDQLVTAILAFHTGVLLSAVVAYLKYGDRTELFRKSLEGTNTTLESILRSVSIDLETRLNVVFAVQDEPQHVVLRPDGNEWSDKPVSPVGSEKYREAIRDFVISSNQGLRDSLYLTQARDAWCRWAKRLSWLMLGLVCWELIASSFVWSEKIFVLNLADWLMKFSASITAALILAILVNVGFLQHYHSNILDQRQKHGPY